MSGRYDAVVIGAGQNGLTAAACLAKAGQRVLVLERRDAIGGSNHTAELHPGFRVDRAFHQAGWLDPALAAELGIGVPADAPAGPDPAVFSPLGDSGFTLPRAPRAAAEALRRFSPADAGRWEAFCALAHKLAGFLQHLYGVTPPQLTSTRAADLVTLLGLGRRVRGMGREDMIELLRVLPMSVAELLDDWFETDALKGVLGAGGITGIAQGPRSAGTAFVMLHHMVGNPVGVFRGGGIRPGGAGGLTSRLAAAAEALGVATRTGAEVVRIMVAGGRRPAWCSPPARRSPRRAPCPARIRAAPCSDWSTRSSWRRSTPARSATSATVASPPRSTSRWASCRGSPAPAPTTGCSAG